MEGDLEMTCRRKSCGWIILLKLNAERKRLGIRVQVGSGCCTNLSFFHPNSSLPDKVLARTRCMGFDCPVLTPFLDSPLRQRQLRREQM